ncbi:uncharacterized protein si:dkey-109l4.3 [Electrophorus electricus]|uniref:uncharacterized protein si:dkey-109l4.3 n=1 Tax=Electrophorus electricus TaxID=8005 RepID=UPI0015CFA906|nr:uncharacterized protein si:dkey-109l4.3 [Electrophorus electricus]
MEFSEFPSTSNGQALLQKWENGVVETSSDYLLSKRKRSDPNNMDGSAGSRCNSSSCVSIKETKKTSSFVMIDGQRGVYYSETWKPNGGTLYLPVSGGVLANMAKYDQISFEQGCFCIGDAMGRFQNKAQGQAVHCWRYSVVEKKLFIALTYFFTNFQVFQEVLHALECL